MPSNNYLSWPSIVIAVLLLLGLAAAFLAAVGSSRSQDALNSALVQEQEQDTSAARFLRRKLTWNRRWSLLAALALGLVLIVTVFDRVNDYHEKQSLRRQIASFQTQLGSVPGHYLALSLSRDQQDKLLANLNALHLDPVKEAPNVYSECGSEETRVASELAWTFRQVYLAGYYNPERCGPDPYREKKGITAYIIDGTQDSASVKRILGSFVGTGISLTVKRGSSAQLGDLMEIEPVSFYIDGD